MGYKPVQVENAIDLKKNGGEPVEGTFVGHKEIETKIGPQVVWQFTDFDGNPFGVYGFTNLNRAMESVGIGKQCRLTYQGTKKVQTRKFGLKEVHQVLVEIDDEQTGN